METGAATELAAGNSSAATEHTAEPQLAEIQPRSTAIELKVVHNKLVTYTYTYNGEQKQTEELEIVLQSKVPEQYCLGIAKRKGKDATELKKLQDRWQTGTTWKFTSITLQNDKPAYIHTACRIAIDLRQSQAQALLQSTSFPQSPVPTVTTHQSPTVALREAY